jgi:pilus assembly protein CpaB
MNWKTWVPIAAAVVLGLIAAKVGRDVIASRGHAPAAAPIKVVRVVVAADNIAVGAALKETDLSIGQLPDSSTPEATFNSVGDLVDRVPVVPLVKGQAILEPMLAPKGTPNGLTAVVPEGMRAITLEINEVSGVGGMLMPGCHVDLLMTLMADGEGPTEARTIVDNVKILAVGRRFGAQTNQPGTNGEAGDTSAARTVTLVVTPEQAHVIELATHNGQTRFVLRGAKDDSSTSNLTARLEKLRGKNEMGKWQKALAEFIAPTTRPGALQAIANGGPTTAPAAQDVWNVQVIRATVESTVSIPVKPGELKALQSARPGNTTPPPDIAATDAAPAVPK